MGPASPSSEGKLRPAHMASQRDSSRIKPWFPTVAILPLPLDKVML